MPLITSSARDDHPGRSAAPAASEADPRPARSRRFPPRSVRYPAIGLLGVAGVAVLVVGGGVGWAAVTTPSPPLAEAKDDDVDFDGESLLVLSDADMVGSAYADGILRQVPGDVDTLTVIDLPQNARGFGNAGTRELPVSNSVRSWPQVLAVSPDGGTAYVAETRGQVPDDVERVGSVDTDLPDTRDVLVVELASGDVRRVDVGLNPVHLSLSPDGRTLAVGTQDPAGQLVLIPTDALDDPSSFVRLPQTDAAGDPVGRVHSVAWHPTAPLLAVGLDDEEVVLLDLSTEGSASGPPVARRRGEPLALGNTLTYGEFTPDGRHYVTAELNWAQLPGPLGNLLNPRGELIVLDVPADGAPTVASRVAVGHSPEGFAIHPDGELVVSVDMRRTYLPDRLGWYPGAGRSSLTLVRLEPSTGELSVVEDYAFEGVLPEQAAFDVDGDALAVVVYNDRDDPMATGWIDLWRVDTEQPALQRTTGRLQVVRGPHTLLVVPGRRATA